MIALTLRPEAAAPLPAVLAAEPGAAWQALGFADLVPPATLGEARTWRDRLAALLSRERHAAADFLLALADFDRRRGWERLGHASLFAFLTRELGLSAGAAHLRLSAARLLPRHPEVEAALRSGRLCLSAVGQVARVLTPGNESEVLPRFLGLSAREAQEVAAALLPCPAPPRREVVTALPMAMPRPCAGPLWTSEAILTPAAASGSSTPAPLQTSEVPAPRPARVEPLDAELRRLHVTVSRRLLEKIDRARDGLSHALPGAATEQVLEVALDLLLEKQARAKALVKRPRSTSTSLPTPTAGRPHIPAAIEREVRQRDSDQCQYPLDAGGVCGSTWKVELDHIIPVALGGATTADNLRCCCGPHNRRSAEETLGLAAARARRR
jgi:5-methylcytosine-specific restriction endonuclease McrA